MGFATRTDLLARSNARRLAQLSVPTDMDMVPDEALRVAIAGGDVSGYSTAEQLALAESLATIDKALGDADALILSYGIPSTVQTTLLARLASVIALYYLQGAERLDKQDAIAYDGAINTLKSHARGDMNLIPAAPTDPVPSSDLAFIESKPGRYGRYSWPDEVGL
jgi:phage gp36-like protein